MREFINIVESITPAENLLNRYREFTEPYAHGERQFGQTTSVLALDSNSHHDTVHVDEILSLAPKSGDASRFIKKICRDADELGVSLTLSAVALIGASDQHMNTSDLVAWYERNGFVKVRKILGGFDMKRTPKTL